MIKLFALNGLTKSIIFVEEILVTLFSFDLVKWLIEIIYYQKGGPLFFGSTQVGIVSYSLGSGCKTKRASGFANVGIFNDWIKSNAQ